MLTLNPVKRRMLYVGIFEILGVALTTLLLMLLGNGSADHSLPVAVMVSTTAVVWNFIYNTLFERWERCADIRERTLLIRALHATGFEGGLFLFCLPLYMWWFDVGVWHAMLMESALLLFFLVYTFVFTLVFDQIFTLPNQQQASAQQAL